VVYEFGEGPESATFTAQTTQCSSPKNLRVLDETIDGFTLNWTKPDSCSGFSSDTINYKVRYRELNATGKMGRDAVTTVIVNGTSILITGLKSSKEYDITIEAVQMGTRDAKLPPPPPTIVHNNELSLITAFTKPSYPKAMKVLLIPEEDGVRSAKISWKETETSFDRFRVLYDLKYSLMELPTNEECQDFPIPITCKLKEKNIKIVQTSEADIKLNVPVPDVDVIYKFAVRVKTPHGTSVYSPAVYKTIKQ